VGMKFPWEQKPQLPAVPVEDTVAAMQRDMAYIVTHTAVMVHSNQPALSMLVNTPRGQIVPRGECRFTDGSTIEFQDIGAPQVGAPVMSVQELMARVWGVAHELGLELRT